VDVSGCTLLEKLNCAANVQVKREGCSALQVQIPKPKGTLTVNMRNSSNGHTVITPRLFDCGFYIGSDDNFHSTNTFNDATSGRANAYFQFEDIGKVDGLGSVHGFLQGGLTDMVAVTPGHGYIARYRFKIENKREKSTMWKTRIIRMYVVRNILSAGEYPGIIGAEIDYVIDEYDE
jgi:hypothetical protein